MTHSRAYRVIVISVVFLMALPAWGDHKNLFTWFRGGESTVIGPNGDSPLEYYPFGFDDDQCSTLPLPLAEFVFAKFGTGDPRFHLLREDIFRCYGELSPDQYRFRLELTDEGIRFLLPLTGNHSCGEEIRATFKELAPFMNEQGLRYVSQLKKPRQSKRHQP
jgi:hypothetical protein